MKIQKLVMLSPLRHPSATEGQGDAFGRRRAAKAHAMVAYQS